MSARLIFEPYHRPDPLSSCAEPAGFSRQQGTGEYPLLSLVKHFRAPKNPPICSSNGMAQAIADNSGTNKNLASIAGITITSRSLLRRQHNRSPWRSRLG